MIALFNYLIFPGFVFSAAAGLFAGWVDRKVTARLQYRKGPPWHQNFTDIIKLLGKETIVPEGSTVTFLLAPFLGLISSALVGAMLGSALFLPGRGFSGDIIIVIYLLTIPAISLILGASASRNPLASIGASREIKMLLSYELPFILSIIAVVIKSAGALQIQTIVEHQALFGSNLISFSGCLAFFSMIFCMQAKLCMVPFDASEAEQELMAGVLIEYSGLPLAVFKLTKAVMLYTVPVLVIALFLGRDISPVFLVSKYLMLLVIAILIKNTNPRLRIDQAMRFFWRVPTVAALIAVGLALFGF